MSVAVDPNGDVVAGGSVSHVASLGGLPVGGQARDGVVAKYDGRTGAYITDRAVGSTHNDWVWTVATTSAGEIYAGGSVAAALTLEPALVYPMIYDDPVDPIDDDAFVAKLDAQLAGLDAVVIGGPYLQTVIGLAVNAAGSAFALVEHDGPITAPVTLPAGGQHDLAVIKLSPALDVEWAVPFADAGSQVVRASPVAGSDGSVTFAGEFTSAGPLSFNALGGSCDEMQNPTALPVVFVTRLASDGTCLYARRLGVPNEVLASAWAFAVAPDESVYVGGTFQGHFDLDGDGSDPNAILDGPGSQSDAFVVRLGPDGTWVPGSSWARQVGVTDDSGLTQTARGVAVDSQGNAFVAWSVIGTVDAGGGATTGFSELEGDTIVAKYSPSGAHLWSHRYASKLGDDPTSMAVDTQGACVVIGRHGPDDSNGSTLDFGGIAPKPFKPPKWYDTFVAKFAP